MPAPRTIQFVPYDDHGYEAAVTRVTGIGDGIAEAAIHVREDGRWTDGGYEAGRVYVDVHYLRGSNPAPAVRLIPTDQNDLQEKAALDPVGPLTHTDPRLIEALGRIIGRLCFQLDSVQADLLNTGGGCMVARVDLSQDGRGLGRQVWLTREEDWILGFYDYAATEEDEGTCVQLLLTNAQVDDPEAVAKAVADILLRLRVHDLDTPIAGTEV